MARRKNTKRIDPRYFLHETVNRGKLPPRVLKENLDPEVADTMDIIEYAVEDASEEGLSEEEIFMRIRADQDEGFGVRQGLPNISDEIVKAAIGVLLGMPPQEADPEMASMAALQETVNRHDDGSALEEASYMPGYDLHKAPGPGIGVRDPSTGGDIPWDKVPCDKRGKKRPDWIARKNYNYADIQGKCGEELEEGLSKEEAFEAHAPAHFKAMARNQPGIVDMWYNTWVQAQEDEGRRTGPGPDPEDLEVA